jgi:sulfatase-like protein
LNAGPITRRDAIALLDASGASLSFRSAAARRLSEEDKKKRPPNILVFMTDDQRQDAMSVAGNRILQTPNMDRIAREGVRFEDAFVTNSLCGPGRRRSRRPATCPPEAGGERREVPVGQRVAALAYGITQRNTLWSPI